MYLTRRVLSDPAAPWALVAAGLAIAVVGGPSSLAGATAGAGAGYSLSGSV